MTEKGAQKKRYKLYTALDRWEAAIRKDETAPEKDQVAVERVAAAFDAVHNRIAALEDALYALGWTDAATAIERAVKVRFLEVGR